jgi:uncharacterized protein with HEPN domain
MFQDAVIRNLEIIGETSHNINKHYPDYAEQHASVPFAVAYEIRNALTHGYFKVDLEILWKTIELDLPLLLVYDELKFRGSKKAKLTQQPIELKRKNAS